MLSKDKVKELLPIIQKVTDGQDLNVAETEKAFKILEGEDLENYFLVAFLAALHAKGETSDELLGFCKANEYFISSFDVGIDGDKILDLSGTGGDKVKTLNVSTLASFIVASKGIHVAKQAFFAVTGLTGSADLMQAFGVDPLAVSREGQDKIKDIINNTGMVIYHANSMADPNKRKGFFNWINKRLKIGLNHVTIYHLAANAYSPIPMGRRTYGVFDEKYLRPLAELFQKLGYNKGLVFHGIDGLDEISNIGPTKIVEFTHDGIKEYTINPEDLGIKKAELKDIKAISREENINDFLRVLYSKEKGAKRDLVLINAATAFYVMDEAQTIKEGVQIAKELIDSGKTVKKFEEYIKYCGDMQKLEELKSKVLA